MLSLLAFTALAAQSVVLVNAQSPSTVGSPVLVQCQTAAFQYTCVNPPCAIAMRPSNSTSSSYAYFQGLSGATGVLSWAPYVPAGTNLTAYITDAAGLPNYSGALVVNPGVETTCAKVMGFTILPDGTTSTLPSSGSPTGAGGAHTAAESAKPAATTSNKTVEGAAAAQTPGSGAGKVAGSGLAIALVAVGGALLI